ncbi:MAG: GTP-binding protein, partial [Anaerolineae bacterium]|nr:GTP-binding protein [Anaerolineae bacterium]
DKPLSRKCLEGWLRSLPSDVLRIKGFVRLADEEGLWEVQAVRQHHTVLPFASLARQRSVLVAVAHPENADSLISGLEQCAEDS